MALFPLALSVGIIAALLMPLAAKFSLVVPVIFMGWSIFFVAGGKIGTVINGAIPSLFGLLLAYGTVTVLPLVGGGSVALALLVGLLAFIMVIAMNISVLALTPATFLGYAAYFVILGMGGKTPEQVLLYAVISIVVGYISGVVSVTLPELLKIGKKE